MSFYGSAYYWFAILIIGVIAITIWCWRCHKQGQQRQEVIARSAHLHSVQLQVQQQEAQPSNYRPDAPPAYDDVINKPDEYPVYHEGSTITSLAPSSPEYSGTLNETQQLPPYEEVVRSPSYLSGGDMSFVMPELPINADQIESRTDEQGDRR